MEKKVTALVTEEPFDLPRMLHLFNESESFTTGTVVMHHGKVKTPGKVVKIFSRVLLEPVIADPERALSGIGKKTLDQYALNQVMIVHRLGEVKAGDDVLFAAVSAPARSAAFAGCAAIVDAIKEEEAIRLTELP